MFHVLFLTLFLTWVHGGTRSDLLRSVPWLVFLILNVLIVLPPQRKGETLSEARLRVWRGMARDPVLYIGLALTTLLLVQWVNDGRELVRNAASGVYEFAPPPRLWIPFSIHSDESFQQLGYWFPPAFMAVLAVRHGVRRSGRRLLLLALVWGGALLSAFGWIQWLSGTKSLFWMTPLPAHFFASFGYPNHAGALFTLLFAISGGLWFQATMDPDDKYKAKVLLIPTVLNATGAFGSASRAAMILTTLLFVAGGIACLTGAWTRIRAGVRIKVIVYAATVLLLGIGTFCVFPDGIISQKLRHIQTDTFYDDSIGLRMHQYQSSWDMAKDYPLFGVGGWGYRHFVFLYVAPKILDEMVHGKGQANVHNDVLQFLAEHGLVGLGLMLAAVGVLLRPILRGAWKLIVTPPVVDWDNPYRPPLLRVPAMIYAILIGTLATVIHSMIDLPFRSPALLVTWSLCLACAPAFLPRPKQPDSSVRSGSSTPPSA